MDPDEHRAKIESLKRQFEVMQALMDGNPSIGIGRRRFVIDKGGNPWEVAYDPPPILPIVFVNGLLSNTDEHTFENGLLTILNPLGGSEVIVIDIGEMVMVSIGTTEELEG